MPIVPGGGDRWAGRRALELVIAEALVTEITDDEARRILGKAFDFVVTPAARRVIAERKAGRVYEAIFSTILEQVSSGDTVFLSGLGAFKLAETAGAGAGAVFPGGVNLGPVRAGYELRPEMREAVFICGDDKTGPGAAWSFDGEWLSWSAGEFSTIDVPYLPTSGAASGEGLITFFKIKSQLIRVTSPLRGPSYFRSVGGFWAVVKGCWHVVDGRYFLEILSGDSSELKAAANAFHGYDYAGSAAGAWLSGAVERVGVDSEKMPAAAAFHSEDMPGMSAAWMLKGYPREVVMMGEEGEEAGHPSWGPVEWFSAAEFNLRYGSSRAFWESVGVVWPELPVASNKAVRVTCRFDEEVKAALNAI